VPPEQATPLVLLLLHGGKEKLGCREMMASTGQIMIL
jgi:hypothetical protein